MRRIMPNLAVVFLILTTANLFAQNQVKGRVTGNDGSPLSAVSVNVKGTSRGTVTDAEGNFQLDIKKNEATIEFSGVGLETKSMRATAGQTLAITLGQESKSLNEVVVTALGIKREKRSLGYATQTIGSEQLNKSGTGNPLSELSGKASGVTVINSSGDPGAGTYIRLRGVTSIIGNNQPLMVIDGVPVDNSINNFDPTNSGFQASGANGSHYGGLNKYFGAVNSPVEFITYDELLFIKAEATVRTSENYAAAQNFYQAAIRANMQKLGIEEDDIDTYIATRGTLPTTSVNDAIAKVAGQEFIALYLNPEAWVVWRRTGSPALSPTGPGDVPRRLLYPQSEYSYNAANTPASTLYTPKIFWDK